MGKKVWENNIIHTSEPKVLIRGTKPPPQICFFPPVHTIPTYLLSSLIVACRVLYNCKIYGGIICRPNQPPRQQDVIDIQKHCWLGGAVKKPRLSIPPTAFQPH